MILIAKCICSIRSHIRLAALDFRNCQSNKFNLFVDYNREDNMFPRAIRFPFLSRVSFVFGSYLPLMFPFLSRASIFPSFVVIILPIRFPFLSLRSCDKTLPSSKYSVHPIKLVYGVSAIPFKMSA